MHLSWIFAFIFYFQLTISYRIIDEELIRLLVTGNEHDDDPTDVVDVELWNEMNEIEKSMMPEITDYTSEEQAWNWYHWRTRIVVRYHQVSQLLDFNFRTNITKENQKMISDENLLSTSFSQSTYTIAQQFNKSLTSSADKELKEIMNILSREHDERDPEYIKKASRLSSKLQNIYSQSEVCEETNKGQCYQLTPYLERLMQIEKDYDRLLWAWKGWHDNCGNKIRQPYLKYIDLLNENVDKSRFQNLADEWIDAYDMGNATEFERIIDDIFEKITPLFQQLHAFVRGRLCEIYPKKFDCNGPIPAHLLGNMWAQQWQDRLDDVLPYPQNPLVNLTKILHEKEYTINDMYKRAEEFFTSIHFYPMTNKFWARSMFVKPTDRQVVCHPSAFNMAYHDDYRVKICTEITEDYYYTIHHEMGHVEYYMSYEHKQPYRYRQGANSAFHEAIGDTIGMYAISPTHFVKLGFLDKDQIDSKYEINFLMRMALQKVAFLPFGYVLDKYRFALFRNQIDRANELNTKWWQMRTQYGGLKAPAARQDPENFDPGAKYHVVSNTPYARYFLSHILQFQFYRALCRLQGQTERLHMCDIYGNRQVGNRFRQMLAMGSSKPWPEVLKSLTGESQLEPQAMLDYFKPLYKWLKIENLARGYPIGW